MKNVFLVAFALLACLQGVAQSLVLKGVVRDNEGNKLSQANVLLAPDTMYTATDNAGRFSFAITPGQKTIAISYTGYETYTNTIVLKQDTVIRVVMHARTGELKEITVSSSRFLQADQLQTTRMSSVTLGEKEINAIPVLGGEADLLKVIQLLPGASKGIEGSTDLFVRGGAADQNLVLLDGAPVYNTGHLLGFLSVFNPDILESVEYVSGAFPADYGGRLSSILTVRTKSAFPDKTQVQGNIGLLASRLHIEHPLIKDKLSFSVAGRRTYIDQVAKVIHQNLPYYFYDLNAKANYRPTKRDEIEFSIYTGDDVLDFNGLTGRRQNNDVISHSTIGNNTESLQWKRRWNNNWSSSLSAVRSVFRYRILTSFQENDLLAKSTIEDIGGKWIISTDSLAGLSFKAGVEVLHHRVSPNIIATTGEIANLFKSTSTDLRTCLETSAFVQAEENLSARWRLSAGLRVSSGIVTHKTYINPEPRLAFRFSVNDRTTLKASYSRMAQYLLRVSSAAVSFPTDIWYPVTDQVKPQTSNQVSLAFQHTVPASSLFFSVETYYKHLNQLVGYREGTNLFLNANFESQLIQGNGRAYGIEVLAKKEMGKLTGWISYTLSWSQRQFAELNNGEWFYARYDRRHNGAIVTNYQISRRISISAVWEFISGSRFTPVIGQYAVPAPTLIGINLVPIYANVNSVKLSDTHRLDIGLKYRRVRGRFQSEWFAGVYNLYNRAAPIGIFIGSNGDGSYRYDQPGLFGLLPFVSYGFKF